jgi:hypothetical protein
MIRALPWKENTGMSVVCEEQNMGRKSAAGHQLPSAAISCGRTDQLHLIEIKDSQYPS